MTESPRRNLERHVRYGDSSPKYLRQGETAWHLHLADEAILVDTLALTALRLLCPHFLDVLQYHVAVSVERLDASEQATVATAGDQDLGVCACGGLEEREGASCELMFLNEGDLVFTRWGVRGCRYMRPETAWIYPRERVRCKMERTYVSSLLGLLSRSLLN